MVQKKTLFRVRSQLFFSPPPHQPQRAEASENVPGEHCQWCCSQADCSSVRQSRDTDFGFPAFCWHNYPLCLPRSHFVRAIAMARKRRKASAGKRRKKFRTAIRKTARPVAKKRKYRRRAQTLGDKVSGAYRAVVDTVKGTDQLRNKLEPPATSETE